MSTNNVTSLPSEQPSILPDGLHIDVLSRWLLGWPAAAILGVICLIELGSWIPNYLTWPWFADHDVFATAALGWERGDYPYRDLRGNNFPGTIYLFWILGRLFGWGQTAPFYVFDAALVVSLGLFLVAWGFRRFGDVMPALVGYGMFLGFYLSLDYSQVAQRDWHGPFFAVAGYLVVQAWPNRIGQLVGAVLLAMGLVVRPQVVLFAPAYLLAIEEAARVRGKTIWQISMDFLVWGLATTCVVALGFLPLVQAGILDDFRESLRLVVPGGSYNTLSLYSFLKQFVAQLLPLRVLIVPIGIGLLIGEAKPKDRRLARDWLLLFGVVSLYGPLSPQTHAYLIQPLTLVWCIGVAILVHLIRDDPRLNPSRRLLCVLLVLGMGITVRPRFSNPRASLEALTYLRQGAMPGPSPNGYTTNVDVPAAAAYPWDDYRRLIEYLRAEVGPDTRVANVLKYVPAVAGPAGRLPAFPAESVAWVTVVRPQDEAVLADSLRRSTDSVVVWAPSERDNPRLPRLEQLTEVIEQFYDPKVKFGEIEVRIRKPSLLPAD